LTKDRNELLADLNNSITTTADRDVVIVDSNDILNATKVTLADTAEQLTDLSRRSKVLTIEKDDYFSKLNETTKKLSDTTKE